MENYIDQKFDQAALKHLKFQILEKIKNDIGKMNTNIKKKGIQSPRNNDDNLIRELRSLIITSNNQKNKSWEEAPENPVPSFPLKENSNDIKKHVPPIKDDVTDFCIDGTAIEGNNTEKEKQLEKKISLNKNTGGKQHWKKEHGIATEEKSEIDIPQPVLAHTHTCETKNSASRLRPSEIEPPKQSEEWRKGATLITGDLMIADLREAKVSSNKEKKVRFCPGAM